MKNWIGFDTRILRETRSMMCEMFQEALDQFAKGSFPGESLASKAKRLTNSTSFTDYVVHGALDELEGEVQRLKNVESTLRHKVEHLEREVVALRRLRALPCSVAAVTRATVSTALIMPSGVRGYD